MDWWDTLRSTRTVATRSGAIWRTWTFATWKVRIRGINWTWSSCPAGRAWPTRRVAHRNPVRHGNGVATLQVLLTGAASFRLTCIALRRLTSCTHPGGDVRHAA